MQTDHGQIGMVKHATNWCPGLWSLGSNHDLKRSVWLAA
ncbi:hypothetical protein JOD69_000345 [Methylocaldum sp. RMAD-M]|nr:hypothetical protein [Methylocaldum sp. RMAD-M]